jgi:hypothetical protein
MSAQIIVFKGINTHFGLDRKLKSYRLFSFGVGQFALGRRRPAFMRWYYGKVFQRCKQR